MGEVLFEDGHPQEAIRYYAQTLTVDPEHVVAWLHQAHAWKRMGLTRKAAWAYRRAAALKPDRPDIHFNLGATLHGLKDFTGAEEALAQAQSLDPEDTATSYLLKAVRQETVSSAPRAYVQALFDRYADSFDRHMRGLLQYRIPGYLRRNLKSNAKQRGGFDRALDVGCGTGLAGEALRDMTQHMTGVDIAGNILDHAARKEIYDQLVQDDFRHYLAAATEDYDLIVAADVFIYIGDLDPVLALIRQRLAPSGCLAFSLEKDAEGRYRLQRSGRFAHSQDYIVRLAANHRFRIETARQVPVRMENNQWIGGLLIVMTAV
jgi:predicted TPR repeat methyltransferase